MALNMDDLIGSMQHGFHAGDRGNEINEIRESLKVSLGQQHHPTSNGTASTSTAGPSNSYAFTRRNFQPNSSSLDADVAMLSSSSSSHQPQQYYTQSTFFGSTTGGPGSWGSQSSSSSNPTWGFAPAPANTPQQTPVETSALARQLQAELERQQTQQQQQYTTSQAGFSPTNTNGFGSSPPQDGRGGEGETRRQNGFELRDDSLTPRGSMSPQLEHGRARGAQPQGQPRRA